MSIDRAINEIDKHYANLMKTDIAALREPGIHLFPREGFVHQRLPYQHSFIAVVLYQDHHAVSVTTSPALCDVLKSEFAGDEAMLLRVAQSLNCDDAYEAEVLVGSPGLLNLTYSSSVEMVDANSPMYTDVDGPVFAISNDTGVVAWAGVKRQSPFVNDIRVVTREDMRGKGLAKLVASRAYTHIIDEGLTPYYAHGRGNAASAALAKSLGFIPYGYLVIAESKIT